MANSRGRASKALLMATYNDEDIGKQGESNLFQWL
jgi:hypothetical protein